MSVKFKAKQPWSGTFFKDRMNWLGCHEKLFVRRFGVTVFSDRRAVIDDVIILKNEVSQEVKLQKNIKNWPN